MSKPKQALVFPLAAGLLRFWELHDYRKSSMDKLSGPELDTLIIQITKTVQTITNMITVRQMANIPAPDLNRGFD